MGKCYKYCENIKKNLENRKLNFEETFGILNKL